MKIFLDTANVDDIRRFADLGLIDGVTTNPALIAREGRNFKEVVEEICTIVDGPISTEVISLDAEGMINEARMIAKLHKNIVVKIPATKAGYKALSVVSREGIKTNFTIVYTANQAWLAAKAGATYVSPFVGRLDATSTNGSDLIEEIVQIFSVYDFDCQVLAASMRNEIYVKWAALSGSHIATIPPEVLDAMMESELTDVSLKGFLAEWEKMPPEQREYFK